MYRILGSIFIIASALISYLDKYVIVYSIRFNNNFGYNSSADLVWATSTTIAPLLLIIGANLRPYKISYIFPVYTYTTYLFWVFRGEKTDYGWSKFYAIFITLLFVFFMIGMSKIKKKEKKEKEETKKKIMFLEKMLDLSYIVINRY
ncbi:hypothetical protein [Flavobacterium oreochromis]|uniref:Uncharacterized protein n=2 Tax=Flavobacterium TaxID=237 RepID=A0A246GBD2_9FLAO|nr:hypothetical protein [Flavobacterium oreochromis]OWP76162.1 hypothetical protein BWK62_10360 [Flavobacterium oreochromis]OWP76434.1 hypothetical protein BWG23_08155 [Flavobacterium oreochromis]POR21329.1 hypothetical protein BWK58_12590 [Flavobacterium columnare]